MKSNFVNLSHRRLVSFLNLLIDGRGKASVLQVFGDLSDRPSVCRFVVYLNGTICDIFECTIRRDSFKTIRSLVLSRTR